MMGFSGVGAGEGLAAVRGHQSEDEVGGSCDEKVV